MKTLEKKQRTTGFAGAIHLTPECLKRNENEVVNELAKELNRYVSYKNTSEEEKTKRAQREYDHIYRIHFEIKRWWRFFKNEEYNQNIALTKQSAEAVFCKDGNIVIRNQGSAYYVLNAYPSQWEEGGYFHGTRHEIESILKSGNFPQTKKLPPVNLFFAI